MMVAERKTYSATLGGLLSGCFDIVSGAKITGVTADSRLVHKGDLFVAYKNRDTVVHVKSAINAGASAVVVEGDQLPETEQWGVPVVPLPRLRAQAGLLAAKFFGNPSRDMNVIGMTGTNGKTTVSYLIAQAFDLGHRGKSGLIGTLGCGPFNDMTKMPNTTPEPVMLQNALAIMAQQGIELVAMEVSSHGLVQHRVAGVEFNIAVFTNLSRDHLDYHQTMENYAASKRHLFSDYAIKKAIINLDDAFGRRLIEEFQHEMEIIGYSLQTVKHGQLPVVSAHVVTHNESGVTLLIRSPWGEGQLTSRLIGQFNYANLLASLSVLCWSGMAFAEGLSLLSQCTHIPGRMEFFAQVGKPSVIIDYAHTPNALQQALVNLQSQSSGRLICVFGCGGDRDRGKRAMMGAVAATLADHIFLTNDNPRYEDAKAIVEDIISGIKDRSRCTKELDRRQAIMAAINAATSNDTVLIAGKGHEDYQEIAGVRLPFSDRSIVQEVLQHRADGHVG